VAARRNVEVRKGEHYRERNYYRELGGKIRLGKLPHRKKRGGEDKLAPVKTKKKKKKDAKGAARDESPGKKDPSLTSCAGREQK